MPVVTSGATTVGAVQISGLSPSSTPIESYLNGLLNGRAYAAAAFQTGVAAQQSYAELRNPLGSGKNLWVYLALGASTAAGGIQYRLNSPPVLATGAAGTNLLTGLANSVARIATSTTAAPPGTNIAILPGGANTLAGYNQPWVIVLAPNFSLAITDAVVNDALSVSVAWLEV